MNTKSIIFFIPLVFFANNVAAQDLETGEVEVVKEFEARLGEANKVRLEPASETKMVSDRSFDYHVTEKLISVEYLPPVIKPIGLKTEKVEPGYNGLVKAGFGYPISPYLDAGYLFGDPDASNVFARISHHSANDKNLSHQRFSDNDFLLKGTYQTPYEFAVDGYAKASIDNFPFYGFDRRDSTSYSADDVLNRQNIYELGLKVYNSAEADTKLNYWAGVDAYRFANNYATRETGLVLDLGLTKWFGDNPLTVTLGTDLTRLKDTTVQHLNNFFFNPSFTFGTPSLRFKIGGKLATSNEEYFIYPDIEMLLNLGGNNLSVFAGADGGLRKNNFKTLIAYSPFLVPELNPLRNSEFYDFYGGIKGLISGVDYSLQAGFKPTNNLALFEIDSRKPWNRFDILYDTTQIYYIQASLKGNVLDRLAVSGNVVRNFYDLRQQEDAWYLPELQANVGLSYVALEEKLRLKAEVYAISTVPFKELDYPNEPNLILDFSLGADLFVSQHFGLFLHLNNLSANKYRRWYGYPSYGLNVLGGLVARF